MVEAEERPVVVAVALGALAARHLLPRPRRDMPEEGVGTLGGATEGHAVVAGDRQHIADLARLQLSPQPGVGAVDLVTSNPRRRDLDVQRTRDHPGGQRRLGRKPDLVGNADGLQALGIVGP
jgi:hypothetical protein